MHGRNIVHGDIKPDNIHFRGVDDDIIKLIDFGTSKRIDVKHQMHAIYGTNAYFIAPEVFEKNYSEKCDVWSCGVILYLMIAGRPPFDGNDSSQVIQCIQAGKFDLESEIWSYMSNELKDLLQRMLTRDAKRLSAKEVLHHPWFKLCEKMENTSDSHAKQQMIHKALYNLSHFSTRNTVKQAALGYLIQHFMNASDYEELEQIFQALDTSGEGFLSKEELLEGYKKYYGHDFNEQEVEQLIQMADQSDDGRIGYNEFVMTCVDRDKFLSLDKLEAVFSELDVDHNNMISFAEMKTFLGAD